jgi:hypothetical protein
MDSSEVRNQQLRIPTNEANILNLSKPVNSTKNESHPKRAEGQSIPGYSRAWSVAIAGIQAAK